MIPGPISLFGIGMDRDVPDLVYVRSGTILNLGAGNKHFDWARSLDAPEWWAHEPLPYEDGAVDHIVAFHFLEHVQNVPRLLHECQRVLRPSGTMNIVVPYGASDLALQDLDHKNFFTEDTWRVLFANPYYDTTYGNVESWEFDVGFNMIMGIVHRNLALVTQLIRR